VTINAGTLQVGNGGTSGDLGGAPVTINATLAYDRSNTATLNNPLLGSGALVQKGSGTLVVASTNSLSGFYGTVTVNAGTLAVAGDLGYPSTVTVNSGGALAGLGGSVYASVSINDGGSFSSVNNQAFPINGALTLGNAGSDKVALNFSGNGSGMPGYATVSGSLDINGTVSVNLAGVPLTPGIYPLITYTSPGANSGTIIQPSLPLGTVGYVTNDTTANALELVITKSSTILPVALTNTVSGGVLSLSWPAGQGWRLEWQTNALNAGLGTNWLPLTDSSVSSTNITIDPNKPTVFYRLVNP
jgi:autotransporter-associated beta strand protein